MVEELTLDEIELLRAVYEEGLDLPEEERRRRGLGYKGLAKKFMIPVRTVRSYLRYERRPPRD